MPNSRKPQPRSIRPNLEMLESRDVPQATTTAIASQISADEKAVVTIATDPAIFASPSEAHAANETCNLIDQEMQSDLSTLQTMETQASNSASAEIAQLNSALSQATSATIAGYNAKLQAIAKTFSSLPAAEQEAIAQAVYKDIVALEQQEAAQLTALKNYYGGTENAVATGLAHTNQVLTPLIGQAEYVESEAHSFAEQTLGFISGDPVFTPPPPPSSNDNYTGTFAGSATSALAGVKISTANGKITGTIIFATYPGETEPNIPAILSGTVSKGTISGTLTFDINGNASPVDRFTGTVTSSGVITLKLTNPMSKGSAGTITLTPSSSGASRSAGAGGK